jgi:hypothetical protein
MARFSGSFGGYNPTSVEAVELAISVANAITSSSKFYRLIAEKPEPFDADYTSDEATPAAVANALQCSTVSVNVRLRKHWRWVLGWVNGDDHENINLNVRRLRRPVADIVRTLVHEWVHAVDMKSELDFHHGTNDASGKQNTAPYWIDALAGQLATEVLNSLDVVTTQLLDDALADGDDRFCETYPGDYDPAQD